MAHNIQTMAYVGKVPWHGLGTYVGEREITSEEALLAAGLNWKVEKVPMYIPKLGTSLPIKKGDQLEVSQVPDLHMIRRMDNGTLFGEAGPDYNPVQNAEAFKFFDGVVTAGEAMYHTAGALGDGKIVWILAKLPTEFQVVPGDKIEMYVLLSTSHEPGKSLQMMITPIRVVCENTMNIALSGRGNKFRHIHVRDVMGRVNEAREVLGLAEVYGNNLQKQVDRLVNAAFTREQMRAFARVLVGAEPNAELDELTGAQTKVIVQLGRLFTEGTGQKMVTGTRWAAFNAVTEYVDHLVSPRVAEERKQTMRLESAWFGNGAKMKQRAYDLLTV